MKTESNTMFIVRLAATLLAICGVVALALAGVNAITKGRIAELKSGAAGAAVQEVLPGGGKLIDFTDDTGMISAVYGGENGYAVQVTTPGFGGDVEMMVGVAKDGTVLGISIISHSETSGLGAVAASDTEAGQSFRGQFVGMSGTLAVNKDGGSVDALSGATITSRAVTAGVNAALSCTGKLG